MINKYVSKEKILLYFFRILILNSLCLVFLYDSSSFNSGLISYQSILYSISKYLIIIFLLIEAIAVFFDYYGLDIYFFKLIVLDIFNIDYEVLIFIFSDRILYLLFLFFGIIIFINEKVLFQYLFRNIRNIFLLIIIIPFILLLPTNFSSKITSKILNFDSTIKEYNLFRNDNWFIVLKNSLVYKNNLAVNNLDKFVNFEKIIDAKKNQNIYIVINESYPNFKNKLLEEELYTPFDQIKNNFTIEKYVKDWSRKYTTQAAEMKLFCGSNQNFYDFKTLSLNTFMEKNNCYFKNLNDFHKVFIHSTSSNWFNRNRYDDFFDKMLFYSDLVKKNYPICDGTFSAICDHEIILNLDSFKKNNKNMILFLTTNNHYPSKLLNKKEIVDCKKIHPLNLNNQMCIMFKNQMLFNENLVIFLNKIDKNDLVIFFPDTPPIFPNREMIHFKDKLDVFTFQKI